MFIPVKNDTGAVQPLEYLVASPGEYKVGQLLKISGELEPCGASTTTPSYLCMANETVSENEIKAIPVARVNSDTVYEVDYTGDAIAPGTKVAVGADSLTIDETQTGTFEIVQNLDGAVRGRFVPCVSQAAAAAAVSDETE